MVRNLKFLAILAAMALAILACSLTGGDTPPSGNESGSSVSIDPASNVLFQDDFSDPTSGWDQINEVEGITDYSNGVYRILVNTDNTDVWANPGLSFSDTVTEVEATKVGGPDDNDLGLICRYQDESNFYFFIISSDGFYGIAKVLNGEQELVGLENMEYSEAINQGNATNRSAGRMRRPEPDPVRQRPASIPDHGRAVQQRRCRPDRRHLRCGRHRCPLR